MVVGPRLWAAPKMLVLPKVWEASVVPSMALLLSMLPPCCLMAPKMLVDPELVSVPKTLVLPEAGEAAARAPTTLELLPSLSVLAPKMPLDPNTDLGLDVVVRQSKML